MFSHQDKQHELSDTLVEHTLGEDTTRGLVVLFVRIWVICLILNLVGGWALLGFQMHLGMDSMMRDTTNRVRLGWIGQSPWPAKWPAAKHQAIFRGPIPYVHSVYAISWNDDGTKYFLDAVVVQLPASMCSARKTRAVGRNEAIDPNQTTDWVTSYQVNPIGMMVNPCLHAGMFWIFVGGLPMAIREYRDWTLQRKRERDRSCLHCGYDIQELPTCPECGHQSHLV